MQIEEQAKDAWINTYGGNIAYPLAPEKTLYDIEDIAHSLALQCRWNGHTKRFFSVAQHSCLCHDNVSSEAIESLSDWYGRDMRAEAELAALMHDGTEYVLTDVARPIKPYMGEYQSIEKATDVAICNTFGIFSSPQMHEVVKEIDNAMLIRERAVLINRSPKTWGFEGHPDRLEEDLKTIPYWSPRRAKQEFLNRFYKLSGRRLSLYDHVKMAKLRIGDWFVEKFIGV